jgi:hypothetical protein
MSIEQILEGLNNPTDDNQRLDVLRYVLENDVDVNIKLESVKYFNELHESFNQFIRENGIDESCVVGPNDTAAMVRKKCKKAFKHNQKYHPIYRTYVHAAAGGTGDIGGMMESSLGGHNYHPNGDYSVSYFAGAFKKRTPPEEKKTFTHRLLDPEAGFFPEDDEETLEEKKKTSTERVRRYYKRHPEKVREYLRKTVKDRVARNRDRAKAVKKYGKKKMKNHDVHHPNGAQNGNWRLAKKDHGRDKKNESVLPSTGKMTCRFCSWSWDLKDGGEHPYTCHKCWNDNTQVFLTEDKVQENINKFVEYVGEQLKLTNIPQVKIVDKIGGSYSSLGSYTPADNQICVVVKGRLLADILRTIAHELIHAKQMQMGLIKDPTIDGKTGSRIENSANALAGIVMRNYGQLNQEIFLTEGLIMEGGAAGHLAHPFEDPDLTFADMKTMIDRGLTGGLDAEAPVTEKLDGQNIAFTVRDDGVVAFARNKGHVKNRGRNALDVAGIRQMFAGRGAIQKAFTGAAEDLQAAVEKLTPEQRQEMFGQGAKFMSLEIMLPDTQNVIPYGKSVLVMHGTIEYDEDGKEIGRNNDEGKLFADAVTAVGADRQRTFGIEGPRTITFNDAEQEQYTEKAEKYKATLDRAAAEFGLDEKATLSDYRRAWWGREVDTILERDGISITPEQRDGLITRWADGNKKAIGVKDLKEPEQKEWFRKFESEELPATQKRMIRPIEYTFLKTGADSLRRVTNFMASNNPQAAQQLRQDTLDAIKAIQDSDDPNLIAKLQRELERLDAMGMDNIVPSEGVVFIYDGKPYKFTGTFAPINQITGTFKFGMPPKEEAPEETPEEPKEPATTEPETDKGDEWGADIPDEWKDAGWKIDAPSTEEPTTPTEPRKTVAIFVGRFQPFHAGHYSIYESLVERFGKENVFIGSSDKTDAIRSPFPFVDKKKTMTRMFDIPEDMVVQVKNPYAPKEITDKLPEDTVYVTAVSQKDAERLGGGKYFKDYDETPEEDRVGYAEGGYFIVAPEMQLNIDGKNISGTQLRHVFGSPEISDRAKQEIFTKVYGKFDPDVFGMVVKKTSEAEEASRITNDVPPEDVAKPAVKADISQALQGTSSEDAEIIRQSGVLTQKIRNEETGREILVASALSKRYEGTAVQDAAKELLKQTLEQHKRDQQQKSENMIIENIMEEKKVKKIKQYLYTRDYTDEELDNEIEEYFENERTKKLFPGLASDKTELKDMIEDAEEIILDKKFLKMLANSEVPEVLSSDNPAEILKKIQDEYDRDVAGLLKAIKNEEELPLPIVIQHPQGVYLMAGNSRLSVLASINHTMPVKLLKYVPDTDTDDTDGDTGPKMTDKEVRKARRKEFKAVLDTKIINPETGNKIKVNTAMDYNKNHPAHKVAMELIRSRMAGLSPTAGIPKKPKS